MENEINQAHIEQKTDYGASNIQALEGLEAIGAQQVAKQAHVEFIVLNHQHCSGTIFGHDTQVC